eukprot:1730482-Pleurochrysis_carterae.AAC.1
MSLQQKESSISALEENYKERINELEELLDFQESEFDKALKEADAKAKQARKELREMSPPGKHAWDKLSDGGARWARKVDVDFFTERLMDREWRAGDVASALDRANLLEGVFKSCEVWTTRITYMNAVLDRLQKEQWEPSLTASMVVALNISQRN